MPPVADADAAATRRPATPACGLRAAIAPCGTTRILPAIDGMVREHGGAMSARGHDHAARQRELVLEVLAEELERLGVLAIVGGASA